MTFGNEIVFVVLTSDNEIVDVKDFSTYQRCVLEVKAKKENKEINEKELHADNRPSPEEIQDLEKCLRENAKLLMERHTKLTLVTAGWFKASVDETGQYSVKKELCIVLYVHVKGFLPLNEKPFPTKLEKYPVDVREGIFTLCGGPYDYHRNVKMGCGIRGEGPGTLGAFVEFENDGNLYGITCAHVVFGNEKLKWILEHGYTEINSDELVYQPVSDPFGTAVVALYKEGGNGIPGMEIALIKINQDRLPTDGTFPDDSEYAAAGFGPDRPFVFCSGKVWESESRLQYPVVYKYGCESKLTTGICRVNGASVRTHVFKANILGSELVLHDQIEIQSLGACPFAKLGDSGALIFTNEQIPGELSALGIFEGQMENVFTATPICAVLGELRRITNKHCMLKTYHS
ncbi:uncharacterized protein LOC123560535 [Mercenaria mercenaria]|uniref:uncharacterized protein LOC123560535 n=1 Tax=Mercenaria mercenaria TaxID=6596 RepID=UPI001E1DD767|nr:uncharacterized protein LOC123560535 [Mercenaria mercenaria]